MAFLNPAISTILANLKLVNYNKLKHILITFTIALASTQATIANAFSGDYWGTNGDFSIVTYNVNGLPYFLKNPCTLVPGYQLLGLLPLSPGCLRPDEQDPAITTPEIGRRLGRWDVVNVQEDFAYHAALYSVTEQFGYRTPTTGIPPKGSGLNSLSKMNTFGLERIRWRNCKNEDCISGKGFTFQRLQVGKGSYIDMYNLHAQAGDDGDSLWVRRDNFVQLAEFIRFRSQGNAIIIAGDTNIRWGRDGEPRQFLWDTGVTDAWVQTQRGGVIPAIGDIQVCAKGSETNGCEIVDRIFYRSGDDIELSITGYSNEDRNFIYNGKPLSDHRPVAAWFHWEEKAPKVSMVAEHSGKCLDVPGGSLAAGTQLIQYDCKQGIDNGNQQFRRIGNTMKIAHSGMCLDVKEFSQGNGGQVTQWPCHGGLNQQTDIVDNTFVFKHSGKCLEVSGIDFYNFAPIQQWSCLGPNSSIGNRHQKFEMRWWQ